MATAENKWIKAAWRLETLKENNSIINHAIITMQSIGKQMEFEGETIKLERKTLNNDWKKKHGRERKLLLRKGLKKEG